MDETRVLKIVEKFIRRYAARHTEYDRQVAEAEEASTMHLRELGIDTKETDRLVSLSLNFDELIRPAQILSKMHYTDLNQEVSTLPDNERNEVYIKILEYMLQEMRQRWEQMEQRGKGTVQ